MKHLLFFLLLASVAHSADVRKLLKQGDAFDERNQTRQALEVFLEAEKAAPDDSAVLWRVSKQYGLSMSDTTDREEKLDLGRKALDYAKRAVAADPQNALAQLALSISYGRLAGLLDNKTKISYAGQVKEHAERCIALDPKVDLGYHVLGAWNFEMSRLGPFVRVLAKTMYGELPEGSMADAVRYLEKAVAVNPSRMGNHVELGRVYAALGEKDKARAQLELAIALPSRDKDDEVARQRARDTLNEL